MSIVYSSTNMGVEKIQRVDSNIIITGTYKLNRKYNNKLYIKDFKIKLSFDSQYGLSKQTVWLPDYPVPNKFEHIYKNRDNQCCLGLDYEIALILNNAIHIDEFYEKILDPFLMSLIHYEESGEFLFGERPHGQKGVIDYYSKLFGTTETNTLKFLSIIYRLSINKKEYKGHNSCPCGNGKKYRNCHRTEITKFVSEIEQNENLLIAFKRDYEHYLGGSKNV